MSMYYKIIIIIDDDDDNCEIIQNRSTDIVCVCMLCIYSKIIGTGHHRNQQIVIIHNLQTESRINLDKEKTYPIAFGSLFSQQQQRKK